MRRRAATVLAGTLLTAAVGCAQPRSPNPAAADAGAQRRSGTVVRVIDGDTLEVTTRGGTVTVRVVGIDTPETVAPDQPVECGGPAAAKAARELLAGEQVHLTTEPRQGKRDQYGRLLAYVTLPDGDDFGAVMIRRGHAREATYGADYRRQDRYRRLENQARHADRGLWEACR